MWLDTVLVIEAAAAFCLQAFNAGLLLSVLRAAKARSRRVAAFALVLVCSAQAMEALAFLWLDGAAPVPGELPALALLTVRSAVLLSAFLLSLLLARAALARR